MSVFGHAFKIVFQQRADAGLAALILFGSLGVQSSWQLLIPEAPPPPAALAAIPQAPASGATSPTPPQAALNPRVGGNVNFGPQGSGPAGPSGSGLSANAFGGQRGSTPPTLPPSAPLVPPTINLGSGGIAPQGGFAPAFASGGSAPSVPEPSTWGLIILGLGMICYSAYRNASNSRKAEAG